MAKCPFAQWRPIGDSSGPYLSGPYKIVHHTTEGPSAVGAMATFASKNCAPHFTVDATTIYQHIDTSVGARALRNAPGGVQTNRDGAIQIELVGFAHQSKDPAALVNVARLCRWIESTHGVPRTWPAGVPRPAKNGKDPGGHTRDSGIWDSQGGHYGHCHVPENTHWDPGYLASEAAFVLKATFNSAGELTSAPPAAPAIPAGAAGPTDALVSTMPVHGDAGMLDSPPGGSPDRREQGRVTKGVARTAQGQRLLNARRDTLDFRDKMYVPTLIEVPTRRSIDEYFGCEIPVLDQGAEGACTGFGLATVANYLLRRRRNNPDHLAVSPRMFYELARRYDEWPGEEYSGSSARGAIKGWNKHGVCAETDWPYVVEEAGSGGFTEPRMRAATQRPLGAYFRVNHRDLISMHSAIAEVGILYATAQVHEGWQDVNQDGIIANSNALLGGHAFAIVAYDEFGFWIQNSWGENWGRRGCARVSYDDWLANATDVWVARLGAPIQLSEAASFGTNGTSKSGHSAAFANASIRPHLISLGNEGRLKPGGEYGSSERDVATIFADDIPVFLDRQRGTKRLLLIAHGGLVDESGAVQRIAEYRPALLDAGVYPLAFIWNSDYWSTLTNILQDAVRRRRPEGVLDRAKDFMLDRLDDALEPLARQLSGKAAWGEMKENALRASNAFGGARLVAQHIREIKNKYPELEVHIVAHSAGSILQAPLVQLLTTQGTIASGPMEGEQGYNIGIASCSLWAPACTIELFKTAYAPAIANKSIDKFALYCLDDKTEQDDHCAHIYNKSLLYLVSNAFEDSARIPFFRDGVPILGMEKFVKKDEMLMGLVQNGSVDLVIAPNGNPADSLNASSARHHGDFDDDIPTVKSTLNRILAGAADGAAEVAPPVHAMEFERTMASVIEGRQQLGELSAAN